MNLVKVRTFSGATARLDAELARNLLASEGIECMLPGHIAAQTIPLFDVALMVREEDAERAARLLAEYFDSNGPIPVEQPQVGQREFLRDFSFFSSLSIAL